MRRNQKFRITVTKEEISFVEIVADSREKAKSMALALSKNFGYNKVSKVECLGAASVKLNCDAGLHCARYADTNACRDTLKNS